MRARGGCRLSSWKVRRGRVVVCPPRRGSVATFRWQHSVRVVVSSPRRPAVSSPRRRRRVVAASSSSSSRRRRVVVASCRRRVVIRPASILTGIPTVVVAVAVVAARRCGSSSPLVAASSRGLHKCIHIGIHTSIHIGIHKEVSTQAPSAGSGVSSVPASILTSPPGPVVWVRSEEGKQCSDCGGCTGGCSHCEAGLQDTSSCSDCEGAWTTTTVRACGGCSKGGACGL